MLTAMGIDYGEQMRIQILYEDDIVFERTMPFVKTFGDEAEGKPVLYNNELLKLSLAVSQGSFAERFHIGFGGGWKIIVRKDG